MARTLNYIILVLALATCTGCHQLHVLEVDDKAFAGIDTAVKRSDVVTIFIVHGMGGYTTPDPKDILEGTANALELIPHGDTVTRKIPHPDSRKTLGTLVRQDFMQSSSATLVRFYTLHWSEATSLAKLQYVGYDSSEFQNPHRARLNHSIKAGLVNNGLADVALYLGTYGKTMRIPLTESIRLIEADSAPHDDYELVLVSFSLGSKMLVDAIEELREGDPSDVAAANHFRDSVSSFFMLANQIPLLLLGTYEFPPRGDAAVGDHVDIEEEANPDPVLAKSFKHFIDERLGAIKSKKRGSPPVFNIVAISDPNDLLSYRVPAWIAKQYPDTFVNIIVSISKWGWSIPFIGDFSNPVAAHRNYGQDPKVLEFLLKGHAQEQFTE